MNFPVHGELAGKTVGLLGYGGVGREVARRCTGFGVKLRALSRWSRPERADDIPVERYTMDMYFAFLEGLDYLVVTVPLNGETEGLVDNNWFSAMPSHCVLVNVSRGAIICEKALFDAVSQRRIGGAILDVWYRYPVADEQIPPSRFPFHTLDSVLMTPHASGRTEGTFERRWLAIARNIEALSECCGLTGVVSTPISKT